MVEIRGGWEAVLAELVDVEGEFDADVLVFALGIVDRWAVFLRELGKLDGNGAVGGIGVSDVVADVVRERSDGEGEFVGVMSVAKKAGDEVSRADIVGEVAKENIAEGKVAKILDGAATVSIRVSFAELVFAELAIAAEENGAD